MSMIGPVQSHYHEVSPVGKRSLRWEGFVERVGFEPEAKESSPRHVAQYSPTGSETTPPYAPRSSRFGSEPPSVEDDVDIWRYAILELHDRNDDDE